MRILLHLAPAIALVVFVDSANAQCELTKISPSDGYSTQKFGFDVDADGTHIVVTDQAGEVYTYRRAQGISLIEEKLAAPLGGPQLQRVFAVDAQRVLVGAVGQAYLFGFDASGWSVTDELVTADGYFETNAAIPLPAIRGDIIVLRAWAAVDECPGQQGCGTGAAYVFRRNGNLWVEEQKLTASNAGPPHTFGWSIAIDTDRILLGAIGGNGEIGSAYVFDWDGNTWNETAELTPSNGVIYDKFGYSVTLEGNMAAIGSLQDQDCVFQMGGRCETGAAYVYEWNGVSWNETQILTPSNGESGDLFGISLEIDKDMLLVGAPVAGVPSTSNTGAAYLFRRIGATWTAEHILTASDAVGGEGFGRAVALNNGFAYVGAKSANGITPASGAVYMFGVDGDCDEDGEIDTCEILADPSLDLNGNLELDLCDLSIPTVSAWGVAAMTLLLLTAGSVVMRRRAEVAG